MSVNVACVQFHPLMNETQKNLAKMQEYVEKIMTEKPGTDLIVFPELATSGYECGTAFQGLAEIVPSGDSLQFMADLAKKHKVKVVFGFPEKDANMEDVLFNSAALVSELGEILGVYRKVHPFDTEKQFFRAGCEYPVFDTNIGRLGIMICWDTAFPEVARMYALQGADLIIIPTNWEKPYQDDWDLITRARAFDNTIYIASANRIGPDIELDWFGRSNIIDPLGKPLAMLNEEVEGYITAELDFDLPLKLKKEYYTFFKDRRPDTYGLLTKPY